MATPPGRRNLAGGSFLRALRRLGGAQKPGHGVPAYTRYVNRPLGRVLAAAAHQFGMTPNQVTVLSALVSTVGIVALASAPAGRVTAAVVTSSLLLGYALDSSDGQLARLRGGGSVAGEWLDHVVDAARLPALHAAVVVAASRSGSGWPSWVAAVALAFLVVAVVRFFAMMLTEQMLAAAGTVAGTTRVDSRRSAVRSLALLPVDFGTLALLFALLWHLPLFSWAYGALFALNAAWLVLTLRRRYRDVVGVDRRAAAGPARAASRRQGVPA